jgi:Na+-transporting methylmalonyl-CoA/oxaloacetate decarboxylase gamma subunit
MLTRYMGMSVKSQSYLFSVGFILTLLGMALTDMWLPMVVGAIVLMGLMVESWIRVAHIIPLHQEIRSLKKLVEQLQKQQFKNQEEG